MADAALADKLRRLRGPVVVLGASGFVGAHLLRALCEARDDAFGTASRLPAWRLDGLPADRALRVDLLDETALDALLDRLRPRTVFNCVAYGAYPFEADAARIYRTNFELVARLLPRLDPGATACYVHAGSSSEYGDNAAGPSEGDPLAPNSDYAVSKAAASLLIHFHGARKRLPCANLRLYSVYGPREDPSRLIPAVVRHGLDGTYPEFVDPEVSRDFVYADDVVEAFADAALNLAPDDYGGSFNIGTGRKTTIAGVAAAARDLFGIAGAPRFSMPARRWDVRDWYANPEKARARLGWEPRTTFPEGLRRTADWYRSLPDKARYLASTKSPAPGPGGLRSP
jgi:dolichol-phosphate mannosyltransferase